MLSKIASMTISRHRTGKHERNRKRMDYVKHLLCDLSV